MNTNGAVLYRCVCIPAIAAAWLLAAVSARAASFDGPFEFSMGIVFYVVNPTDQPFTIEIKGQSSAAKPILIRVFDPDERRLTRKDLPENESLDKQLRPFKFTFPSRGKGVHQIHILGQTNVLDFRTYPSLPFGVLGHMPCLRGRGMQFHRAYIYLPPKLPSLHVFAGGIGKVKRLTLSDETGKLCLSPKGDEHKDLRGDVPLPESGEHIWKLSVEADPKSMYNIAFGNAPIILCPDPETARAIHASTDVMADGTLCFHKCQMRAWQLLQKYRQLPASAFEVPLPDLEKYKAEWLKDPVRNRMLLDHVYTKLAYALKDQNLDPKSPWFGTLGVWHDNKGAEYPGNPFSEYSRRDMEQVGMLANVLACIYSVNEPFNPLYRNEALRRRVLIASLRDIMLMKENESVDIGTSFHFGGQAMYFNQLSAPFAYVARGCPRDEYEVWSEGMARMTEHFATAHITNVNQWTWLVASFARMTLGSDDPWYRTLASRHARWIANRSPNTGQMLAGYHWEGQGPDATYEGHSLASLAFAYRVTGDPLMLEAVRRSYDLFEHTVAPEPDGKLLGACSFACRTPGDWNYVQGDAGFSMLADILPQAGRWADVRFPKPATTEAELREATAKLASENRFFTYLPHNFKRSGNGFGVASQFELYRYHCRKPLSGQVPAVSDKPFVKAFGDEFYFVRRPAYYAGFYAGHHHVPGDRSPLKQCEHTGGLMLFWSPGFGSSVLGKNWNFYSANSLLAVAADGKTSREDHPTVRAELKQNPDRLLITGRLYNLPIQFSREYEFLNDRLGVTLTLKATAPVRLASFVECFPYPSPLTKGKPDPITVQTPDGNILDSNARDIASVALRSNSRECHWLVFAEPRRCQAATIETVTHYEDRVRVGSLQVAIPVDWAAGQQRVFRYALGPGAAPAAKPSPSQQAAIAVTTPSVPAVAPPATKAPAAPLAAKLAMRPVAPDKDGFINLLPLIDPQQDAVKGKWELTADGLKLSGPWEAAMLDLPYAPPEEYDFEIEFTPADWGNDVHQHLAVAGRSFVWRMNAPYMRNPTIYCLDYLDNKTARERREAVVMKNQSLVAHQRYTSKVEVRRGSLRALFNGEEFLRWSGDFNRLSMPPHLNIKDYRHLGVGSWKRGVIFHRIAVREVTGKGVFGHATTVVAPPAPAITQPATSAPVAAPAAQPVARVAPTPVASVKPGTINLLPLIDPEKDAVQGDWKHTTDGLVLARPKAAGVLKLPYEPPEEYDFEIEFTPQSDGKNVNQHLIAADRSFAWKLNAYGLKPPIHCLDLLDGKPAKNRDEAVVQKNLTLEPGQRYTSKVEVRRGTLRALVNGEEYLMWSGDFKRLSLEPVWKLPDNRYLALSTYNRAVVFHRIEVREVTGKGTLTRTPPPTSTTPQK